MMKHDSNDPFEVWAAQERERLGGPPTPEEVVAFLRGELDEKDAARVQALLVYYPELTPLLRERTTVIRRWRPRLTQLLPIAAGLVIALWGLLLMQRDRSEPFVQPKRHVLNASQPRGPAGAPYELRGNDELYLLAPSFADLADYPDYRLDIVELSYGREKVIWTRSGLTPVDDAFEVWVPRTFLTARDYRIDVYGLEDGRASALAKIPFRATE